MLALACRRCSVLLLVFCAARSATCIRAQESVPQTQTDKATSRPDLAATPRMPYAWPTRYPGNTGSPLATRIASLLSDPMIAGAHWGIAVTAMDGTPLYGLDEAKLFRPASSAKLFTTAAAMAILGPESTVVTGVYGSFDKDTGTVTGDLVIVGAGDPSFGTSDLPYRLSPGEAQREAQREAQSTSSPAARDLQSLTDQLLSLGVRSVTGNVEGNSELFSPEAPPEGWSEEDLLWGYGALPSALSGGDNELAVTITPKLLSEPVRDGTNVAATVQVDQLVPYLKVNSQVATLSPSSRQPDRVQWSRSSADPATVDVQGFVTSGHAPLHEHLAMADPALYTAQAFLAQLLKAQVQIGGKPLALAGAPHTPQPFLTTLRDSNPCGEVALGFGKGCLYSCLGSMQAGQMLASHASPPLNEEIVFTLKTSANLHAEVLLHRLGLKNACPEGVTTLDGARLVRTWLLHNGIADHDFVFYDGSGLSTKDLVTPRAEAQLLAYAVTQPWFAQWKAAFPVGGIDGTLASRFTQSPFKGRIFAKTGTLGESRALAGYVRCASGREVIFSVLDDNHEPGSSLDRAVMDRIVEAIAELE